MAKGDGTIIERRRGVWEVNVPLGKDPTTGKYRRVFRNVHGTKADARRVRDQIRRELESGIKAHSDKVTLAEFCDEFISNKRTAGKASQNTIDRDKAKLDFICEIMGNAPLKSVDARAVESLYREIRKRRLAQGWGCGNTTLHSYHVILKAVFKKAVDYDLILRNPCERVDAPSIDKVARKSLSAEDAARLQKAVNDAEEKAVAELLAKEERQREWGVSEDRSYLLGMRDVCYVLAVRIALATGMRMGEVLALTWGVVDFSRRSVAVVQALDVKSVPKAPKTEAGKRTVFVDGDTIQHLMAWKELQTELLEDLCLTVDDATPVLCSATGDWLDKNNFGRWWREFREAQGFPGLKFHELRHTQATQLLANGVDVKTVQNRLGHAKASITMDFYAHAVPENDQKAAQIIGSLLREPKKAKIIPMPKSA